MSNWSPIWKSVWSSIWTGIWASIDAACNFTIYDNDGVPFYDPFVDNGSGDRVPATGETKMSNDSLSFDLLTPVTLTDGSTHPFEGVLNIDPAAGDFDHAYELTNGATSAVLRLQYRTISGGVLQAVWIDDAGVTKATTGFAIIPTGVFAKYRVEVDTTMLSLKIDTDSPLVVTTILGGASTVTKGVLSARSTTQFQMPCFFRSFESDATGYTSFISRSPSATDPDANKFFSDNNTIFNLLDLSPFGAYYPYKGVYPDVNLVSDNKCPDNPLVINKLTELAVINKLTGNFVLNKV